MLTGKKLALMTAVISGFSIFFNKFAIGMNNPSVFTGTKNAVVAAGLLALVAGRGELGQLKKEQLVKLAAIGLIGGSVPFILFFNGLALVDAAVAGFLHKSLFIFASLIAAAVLRERVEKKFVAIGAAMLLGNTLLLKIGGLSFGRGELMVLAATLLWAAEQVLSKSVLAELNSRQVALGRMGFGAMFIAMFLLVTGGFELNYTTEQVKWVGVTSVFLFAYVVTWYEALAREKVSTVTAVLTLGAVVTTLLNVAFSGVVITTSQTFGVLLLTAAAGATLQLPSLERHMHSDSV